MALERDPPHLGDIGDEAETWEQREARRERMAEARLDSLREEGF